MKEIRDYWDKKFIQKKDCWGQGESLAAKKTLKFLVKKKINTGKLLDVGCGYGRDAAFFQRQGYDVIGIDFSQEAINLGEKLYPNLTLKVKNFEKLDYNNEAFDIIFGNFFLHLFDDPEKRYSLIKKCHSLLKSGGYFFHSVSSIDDPDFIRGAKCGNLVVNERGVKKYYYSIDLITKEFGCFNFLETIELVEKHIHDFPHEHKSFLVICQK